MFFYSKTPKSWSFCLYFVSSNFDLYYVDSILEILFKMIFDGLQVPVRTGIGPGGGWETQGYTIIAIVNYYYI